MQPLRFEARSATRTLLLHFGAGFASFLVLSFWLALDPGPLLRPGDYRLADLAPLHLLALGWITTTMLGAYLNLVPVALYPARVSERWALRLLGPYLVGVACLVLGFARGGAPLAAGGAILAPVLVGEGLSLAHGTWPAWRRLPRSPTAAAFALAPIFLLELALLGGVMAVTLGAPGWLPPQILRAAPLHMAAALGGWLGLTIVGAAYRLVPLFFTTSRGHEEARLGLVAPLALAGGVLLLQVAALAPRAAGLALGRLGLAASLAGAVAFGLDMLRMIRHRSHGLRDPVTLLTTAAFVDFGLGLAFGAWALGLATRGGNPLDPASPAAPIALAAFALALLTGPSVLIVGQLSRILVFLTTLDLALAARARGEVRKTWNLSRPGILAAGLLAYESGAALVTAALLVRAAGRALPASLVSAAAAGWALGAVLFVWGLSPAFLARRHLGRDPGRVRGA